ncbi:DUF371 domain-containing protein [Actinokineospora auranticolor]|uniref:DUF371 domain-containing protein n=1 Tax=Actinokineospora auranticolor TaxID=155976 RepID=A0A2S6GUT2_9PSEU|nr:DUF371 domain-containing protein [Actinokineospora auranticolor]PPK68998.1 hypothetical protein CLV40_104245 [Actinokineospora auranticolor]
MSTELLRLRCRGHRDIRATHGKTLEFTADSAITGRATCVVGVDGVVVGTPPAALAGRLRITVSVGEDSATVHAVANSGWRPGGSAVVRRSARRLPNTLGTEADLSSADLPRSLVLAMSDPDAVIDVVVTRNPEPEHRVIRYRAGEGHDERLAAECAAADTVLAEDPGARAVITAHGATPQSTATEGRILAVSTTDTISPTVQKLLTARPTVECLGVPTELAVSGATPIAAPTLLAVGRSRKEVLRLATNRHARLVFDCPGDELPRRLAEIARETGAHHASVLVTDERPVWGPLDEFTELTGDVLCAVDPVQSEMDDVDLDPTTLLTALLAQEVSATTLVRALTDQPGWSRKRAYDFVLGLSRKG